MARRLFYVLPDITHARAMVADMKAMGVKSQQIHAVVTNKKDLPDIEDIHQLHDLDRLKWIEWLLWRLNLAVFALMLITVIALLYWQPSVWLLLPLAVMLLNLAGGFYFAMRVPNAHIDEFREALRHGEILIMVDVRSDGVHELDKHIHHKHPEAVNWGVSWSY